MNALVVRRPGGTDVMKLETVPDPVAAPKDVVIKVDACGVCFHDIVTRNGTLKYGVQMPVTFFLNFTVVPLSVMSLQVWPMGQPLAPASGSPVRQ